MLRVLPAPQLQKHCRLLFSPISGVRRANDAKQSGRILNGRPINSGLLIPKKCDFYLRWPVAGLIWGSARRGQQRRLLIVHIRIKRWSLEFSQKSRPENKQKHQNVQGIVILSSGTRPPQIKAKFSFARRSKCCWLQNCLLRSALVILWNVHWFFFCQMCYKLSGRLLFKRFFVCTRTPGNFLRNWNSLAFYI
jgi:hypothetical protein